MKLSVAEDPPSPRSRCLDHTLKVTVQGTGKEIKLSSKFLHYKTNFF